MGISDGVDGLTFEWQAGEDAIGLFAADKTGNIKSNAKYNATTDGPLSDFAPDTQDDIIMWGEGEHDFYAYFPHNPVAGEDISTIPVSLPAAQTQTGTGHRSGR
jgi:hypothetical protein